MSDNWIWSFSPDWIGFGASRRIYKWLNIYKCKNARLDISALTSLHVPRYLIYWAMSFLFYFFLILPGSSRCDRQGCAVGKKRDGRQLCWIWSLSSNVLTFTTIWNNIVSIILHPKSQTHTHTHTHTHTVVSEILNSAVDAITQPARACWSGREGRWWEQRKKGLLFHFQWLHRKFFPLWSHCLQPCRMKWDVLTCCDQDVFLLVSDFFNHTFQNWFIPQTRRTYSLIPLLGCRCLWLMDFFLTFWSALLWVQCDLWLQGQRSAHTHLWVLSACWNKNLNKGCTFT